jgi:uncharacterized protein
MGGENINELILVSQKGDIDSTGRVIEAGADVNEADPNGNTALMHAAKNGSAVAHASRNNQVGVLRLLLSRGADPNVPDIEGGNVINFAAGKGYMEIVRLLAENGADLNVCDKEGNTPLMCAINNKFAGIVCFLATRNTDLTVTNKNNKTAMDLAKDRNMTRIVTELKFKLAERQGQVS